MALCDIPSGQDEVRKNSSRHAFAVSQFGQPFYKYLFGKFNLGITTQAAEMEIIPNLKVFEVDAGAGWHRQTPGRPRGTPRRLRNGTAISRLLVPASHGVSPGCA